VTLAIPAVAIGLLAFGFFLGSAFESTIYLPSAILFTVVALSFATPALYLLRGRAVDPRPAERRQATILRRSATDASRQASREAAERARREELVIQQRTAEALRDAALVHQETARVELQASDSQRLAREAERQAEHSSSATGTASPQITGPYSPDRRVDVIGDSSSEVASLTIRRISGYLRASGVLWLVLGGIQVVVGGGFAFAGGFTLVLVAIGVWNLIAGAGRLTAAKQIDARDQSVPSAWQPVAGLVTIAIANVLIGGLVGVGLVIFDFVIRDQILRNRALFAGQTSSS
jgi:hypothetical protein